MVLQEPMTWLRWLSAVIPSTTKVRVRVTASGRSSGMAAMTHVTEIIKICVKAMHVLEALSLVASLIASVSNPGVRITLMQWIRQL